MMRRRTLERRVVAALAKSERWNVAELAAVTGGRRQQLAYVLDDLERREVIVGHFEPTHPGRVWPAVRLYELNP